jgi:hypothetical protein
MVGFSTSVCASHIPKTTRGRTFQPQLLPFYLCSRVAPHTTISLHHFAEDVCPLFRLTLCTFQVGNEQKRRQPKSYPIRCCASAYLSQDFSSLMSLSAVRRWESCCAFLFLSHHLPPSALDDWVCETLSLSSCPLDVDALFSSAIC